MVNVEYVNKQYWKLFHIWGCYIPHIHKYKMTPLLKTKIHGNTIIFLVLFPSQISFIHCYFSKIRDTIHPPTPYHTTDSNTKIPYSF